MTRIRFNNIQIDSVSNSSSVSSGFNAHINWNHKSKRTDGFGKLDGKNNHFKNNQIIVNASKKSK